MLTVKKRGDCCGCSEWLCPVGKPCRLREMISCWLFGFCRAPNRMHVLVDECVVCLKGVSTSSIMRDLANSITGLFSLIWSKRRIQAIRGPAYRPPPYLRSSATILCLIASQARLITATAIRSRDNEPLRQRRITGISRT